jgi:catechol 2,3-dioxygenase-like lactoylglutathione lyase family enzyme
VRRSRHYEQTVCFYRDILGLPELETFAQSYGLDGTVLGLPSVPMHLEIVRLDTPDPGELTTPDELVLYLPDAASRQDVVARLAAAGQDAVAPIAYWADHDGTTFVDPDGHRLIVTSWIYFPSWRRPQPRAHPDTADANTAGAAAPQPAAHHARTRTGTQRRYRARPGLGRSERWTARDRQVVQAATTMLRTGLRHDRLVWGPPIDHLAREGVPMLAGVGRDLDELGHRTSECSKFDEPYRQITDLELGDQVPVPHE